MANPTVSTIIGIARNLMRADSGSDLPVLGDSFLIQAIAEADRDAIRSRRRGGGNTPVDFALEFGKTLVAETAVNDANDVSTSDTTITVDSTTGYDASGAAVIWTNDMPDVFFYTSLTATSFVGVTGLGAPHFNNDVIQPLYALPSNFGNFRHAEDYGDGAQLNSQGLSYMEGPPRGNHFATRDDGTTKFLWLPRNSTGNCSVLFDKDNNTIDSIDDLISMPDDWQFFYAWKAIELSLFGRGDFNIIPVASANANRIRLDLLKDRNIGRRVRIRPMMGIDDTKDYLPRDLYYD